VFNCERAYVTDVARPQTSTSYEIPLNNTVTGGIMVGPSQYHGCQADQALLAMKGVHIGRTRDASKKDAVQFMSVATEPGPAVVAFLNKFPQVVVVSNPARKLEGVKGSQLSVGHLEAFHSLITSARGIMEYVKNMPDVPRKRWSRVVRTLKPRDLVIEVRPTAGNFDPNAFGMMLTPAIGNVDCFGPLAAMTSLIEPKRPVFFFDWPHTTDILAKFLVLESNVAPYAFRDGPENVCGIYSTQVDVIPSNAMCYYTDPAAVLACPFPSKGVLVLKDYTAPEAFVALMAKVKFTMVCVARSVSDKAGATRYLFMEKGETKKFELSAATTRCIERGVWLANTPGFEYCQAVDGLFRVGHNATRNMCEKLGFIPTSYGEKRMRSGLVGMPGAPDPRHQYGDDRRDDDYDPPEEDVPIIAGQFPQEPDLSLNSLSIHTRTPAHEAPDDYDDEQFSEMKTQPPEPDLDLMAKMMEMLKRNPELLGMLKPNTPVPPPVPPPPIRTPASPAFNIGKSEGALLDGGGGEGAKTEDTIKKRVLKSYEYAEPVERRAQTFTENVGKRRDEAIQNGRSREAGGGASESKVGGPESQEPKPKE